MIFLIFEVSTIGTKAVERYPIVPLITQTAHFSIPTLFDTHHIAFLAGLSLLLETSGIKFAPGK